MPVLIVSLASLAVTGVMAVRGLVSETKTAEKAMQSGTNNIMGLILVGTAAYVIYRSFK